MIRFTFAERVDDEAKWLEWVHPRIAFGSAMARAHQHRFAAAGVSHMQVGEQKIKAI